MAVQFKPNGYHSVTPYLIVNGAAEAIRFYQEVLGADELFRIDHGGKIGHAELKVGDSIIMMADEHADVDALSPATVGGTPVKLMVYVEDCDAVYARAVAAGAAPLRPLQNQFYGDRSGSFRDPFGHEWTVATHIEDVSPEEINRRAAEAGNES